MLLSNDGFNCNKMIVLVFFFQKMSVSDCFYL